MVVGEELVNRLAVPEGRAPLFHWIILEEVFSETQLSVYGVLHRGQSKCCSYTDAARSTDERRK
jgi:hypothetical protein